MTLGSRLLGRYFDLPPVVTRDVRVHRDLPVPMRDGVILRTDHYEPRQRPAATILQRTPYGRKGMIGLSTGRLLAERGFHVLLQSCRGTFDSGGVFEPMAHEREDGLDTVAWIERQPWFDGNLFTYGPSYLGFTQWAIAADAGPALKGMVAAVTSSVIREPTYAGGAYSLDTILNWATLTANQGGSLLSFMYKQSRTQKKLRRAWTHLPLSEVDTVAVGRAVPFFQEWLTHTEPGDPYWQSRDHDRRVSDVGAPVCFVGGWYDMFLPWQLRDYAALRAAGRWPRLVIGEWSHADLELMSVSMREGIAWFRSQLNGGAGQPGGVRIHVGGGGGGWRDLPDWPPPFTPTPLHLGPGFTLGPDPATGPPDRFRYDPADPTPSPGGALLTKEAGRVDNTAVEARPDVLVYTTEPMTEPYEAIGPVTATLYVRSTVDWFDVHVRLCEVDRTGRSENLADGLVRVTPGGQLADPGGVRRIEVELWPLAYCFPVGHRIRLQVAGAAHPRTARNPGTGEPLASATRLVVSDTEVFHDADHPSAVYLPRPCRLPT